MAINIGVSNVARKAAKIYVGINGIARKVSKAYIGVNNIAKCFWKEASLTWSTPTALSVARYGLAATAVGNYALFGGGYVYIYTPSSPDLSYYSAAVDAYPVE
ncbi:MAG: hypothetical protein LBH43_06155 [Treponema sp.]|jgi:hypothetical protein|nr:hypothetical protein [Treponema sp.]